MLPYCPYGFTHIVRIHFNHPKYDINSTYILSLFYDIVKALTYGKDEALVNLYADSGNYCFNSQEVFQL